MKKVLVVVLTLIMVASLGATVFAANGGFVSSPSENPAPKVEEFEPADDECTATLVITPYNEKEELPTALETLIERAYTQISTSADISKLNTELAKAAADKNIKAEDLAVGDLFDIHPTGCDFHDGHVDFDITLSADTLKHFVGLLHMKQDGVWEWVADAKVTNDGEHLKFSVESFSPFAIVVDGAAAAADNAPQTGDSGIVYLYVAIMVVAAVALVVLLLSGKKKKSEK